MQDGGWKNTSLTGSDLMVWPQWCTLIMAWRDFIWWGLGNLSHEMGQGARLSFLRKAVYKSLWVTFSCLKKGINDSCLHIEKREKFVAVYEGFVIFHSCFGLRQECSFSFFVGASGRVYWKLQWVLWICYRCRCCRVFDAGEWYDSWALSRGCHNWWRCMFLEFIIIKWPCMYPELCFKGGKL